jgi:DNA-binding transcriptional LysR family regulator
VAKDQRVNPAAVSRAIMALEAELGFRLFQRTTRKIQPTEAGRAYFERVESLVEELGQAQSQAKDLNEVPRGALRIASPVSFAELNLVPLLPEFAALYPELTFDLRLTDADLDVVAEHIDVSIRVVAPKDKSLASHRLSPYQAVACATPDYLRRHGRPVEPADLGRHAGLVLGLRGFHANTWKFTARKGGRVKRVKIRERLRSSNAIALKQCALGGMGVTLLARWIVGRELRRGELVDLFPAYDVTSAVQESGAWVLYPSKDYLPKKVRLFVDFLMEKFAAGPPGDRD